jgi:hypothetical protein
LALSTSRESTSCDDALDPEDCDDKEVVGSGENSAYATSVTGFGIDEAGTGVGSEEYALSGAFTDGAVVNDDDATSDEIVADGGVDGILGHASDTKTTSFKDPR